MARPKGEIRKQVSAYFTPADIIKYKRAAVELGVSFSDLIESAVREMLENNKLMIAKAIEDNNKIGGSNA